MNNDTYVNDTRTTEGRALEIPDGGLGNRATEAAAHALMGHLGLSITARLDEALNEGCDYFLWNGTIPSNSGVDPLSRTVRWVMRQPRTSGLGWFGHAPRLVPVSRSRSATGTQGQSGGGGCCRIPR